MAEIKKFEDALQELEAIVKNSKGIFLLTRPSRLLKKESNLAKFALQISKRKRANSLCLSMTSTTSPKN